MKLMLMGDFSPTNISNPYFIKKDISTLFTDAISLFEGNT